MKISQRLLSSLMVGLLAAGTAPAAGCKKDQSATGATAQNAMGLYAEGFNVLIAEPQGLVEEYFKAIPEEGPDETKNNKLFPRQNFARGKIDAAKKSFAAAKSGAPASLAKLPPMADATIVAIEKVYAAFEAAQKYYDAETYKDDKFAKGKEIHAQMLASAKEFKTAIHAFSEELSAIEDAQAEAELKKFDAKSARYWFRFGNSRGKKLLAVVHKDLSETYVKDLEAALAEYAPVKDGVVKFVADNGAGLQEGVRAVYSNYRDRVESLFATATKVKRAAADFVTGDGKNNKAGLERVLNNELEAATSDYNNMVSAANSLYDLEGNGLLK
jgi:hypothetical protein